MQKGGLTAQGHRETPTSLLCLPGPARRTSPEFTSPDQFYCKKGIAKVQGLSAEQGRIFRSRDGLRVSGHPPVPHADETPISLGAHGSGEWQGHLREPNRCLGPAASHKLRVSSCEARVGEELEHHSRSVSIADSPRCASAPFPNNSRPGTGNGGKKGRVGRISPFSVFRTLDPHRRTALAHGSEKTSELDGSAGSSVR